MKVDVTHGQGRSTLIIEGRVDASSSLELEKHLKTEAEGENHVLVLSLASLEFISSAGLRVLIACYKTIKAKKGRILLCGTRPHIKSIFDLTNISRIFEFFDSVQEAEAALKT